MRSAGSLWMIAFIMLLLDLYVFWVMRAMSQSISDKWRIALFGSYWLLSLLTIIALITFPYWRGQMSYKHLTEYIFAIILGLVFAKLLATVFFLVDDIRRGAMWLMSKLFRRTGADYVQDNDVINRSAFLSWLGFIAGSTLFGSLVYGFTNKYDYQLRKIKLSFNNLPSAFKGFKIVQISDIHSGSFNNKEAVIRGVDMVLKQKPDLILFTGDLVNDRAIEMTDYADVFSRIKAPYGVYSTLGNHDYGDYYWGVNPAGEAAIEKANNMKHLKQIHANMGWRLLMNEHVPIEKDGQSFALIGIENWGAKAGFPKYGRMDLAYPGAEKYSFKILMSHDPSHWDAQVRPEYSTIDLTLAGHTHGMQFGVESPWFKWSPVQWVYKQWAGLYKEGSQYLYVNRGYGFIGYPGRVGILPEITVIELT
jgi:predicted MPP superfamily phosphohydrolase